MQQSPVILDLFEKARSGKSHDYNDIIVFEKLHFQNVFRPNKNDSLSKITSQAYKCKMKLYALDLYRSVCRHFILSKTV